MSKVAIARRKEALYALQRLEKAGKTPAHYTDVYGRMRKNIRDGCNANDAQRDLRQMLKEGLGKLDDKGTVKQPRPGAYSYQPPKPEKVEPAFAAYGIGWKRDKVEWEGRSSSIGKLPGTNGEFVELDDDGEPRKAENGKPIPKAIDFQKQAGIYLLHQGAQTVYVGKTKGPPDDSNFGGLYSRLQIHNRNKRMWDAFSWFGFRELQSDGSLAESDYVPSKHVDILQLITIIEAVVIEGIGLRDNQRGGDIGNSLQFDQFDHPKDKGTTDSKK